MGVVGRVVVLLCLAACAAPSPSATRPRLPRALRYVISTVDGKAKQLQVDLYFPSVPDTQLGLRLPSRVRDQDELFRGITQLEGLDGTLVVRPDGKDRAIVRVPANGQVHVRYRVHQHSDALDEERDRPQLQRKYFFFEGRALLAFPDGKPYGPGFKVPVELEWRLPPDWRLANTFGTESRQTLRVSPNRLADAIYAGGDFRLQETLVRGKRVVVATRARGPWKDEELLALVAKLMQLTRAFWNDDGPELYLLVVLPSTAGSSGRAYEDSAVVHVPRWTPPGSRPIVVITHELLHQWLGDALSGRGLHWLTEGFCEYYAHLLPLRAGLIGLTDYVLAYNDALARLWLSPVKNAPGSRVTAQFWTDDAVQRLPYLRGAILAHDWNARIRRATAGAKGLDHFMRRLLWKAPRRGTTSTRLVDDVAQEFLDGGIEADLDRFIDRGETMSPDPDALGPCGKLTFRTVWSLSFGFDLSTSHRTRVVTNVVEEGAAYRAGLREGQELMWAPYRPDDAGNGILRFEVRVRDAQGIHAVSWHLDMVPFDVPQYVFDFERAKVDPTCISWFADH
jgi:predicted metalloprotease with PDZ domain